MSLQVHNKFWKNQTVFQLDVSSLETADFKDGGGRREGAAHSGEGEVVRRTQTHLGATTGPGSGRAAADLPTDAAREDQTDEGENTARCLR